MRHIARRKTGYRNQWKMEWKQLFIFVTSVVATLAKEESLPLCPTNVQFFPQSLPMHCRMPRSADYPGPPSNMPSGPPNLPPPFYQSPPSDKQPQPLPIPVPPGGPFPYPGPPGGAMPIPMPMMPMPGPAHKLPVIVMPFYSPDPAFKKGPKEQEPSRDFGHYGKRPQRPRRRPHHKRRPRRRPHHSDTDTDTDTDSSDTDTDSTDTSSDTSSELSKEDGWWNQAKALKSGRRSTRKQAKKPKKKYKGKKDLLTPVLQYVTNDGYVIFEKKITKDEAKDWLKVSKDNHNPKEEDNEGANAERRPKEDDVIDLREHKSENVLIEMSTQRTPVYRHHQQHKPNLLDRGGDKLMF